MTVRIGVIADDLTGATDIAGFLAANGLRTVQLNGAADESRAATLTEVDAVVIGLKSRSVPVDEAVAMSRSALAELRAAGAERIVFKYCSTFDSTPAGNIGPVTDALLAELDSDFTVVCPALPVNGRTVYQGTLFVWQQPLNESGMRHHPVTPMTDANLLRVLGAQTEGRTGLVPFATIEAGPDAIRARLAELRAEGVRYAVLDCVTDRHLDAIGEAVTDLPLVTGGSGIGAGLARAVSAR
ncbi:3-oxo-tetronate kinase, partial [Leucobacter sp. M11]|uniref:3-oxo-tetronate kinase n=1 Tax=Leucobacter sp. M11 TaxID=2993565 RepID=UPI002D7EA8A6